MRRHPLILAAIIAATSPLSLSAADKYWDINGDTAGAGGATPSGTWDTATANWNTVADGTGAPVQWEANDTAFFSAGNDATGSYTITVSPSPQTAAGLTVEDGTVIINVGTVSLGGGPILIGPGATLSANSSLRISTTAGSTLTLNGGTLQTTNPGNAGTFFDTDSGIILAAGGGTLSHTTANILSIVQTATTISGPGSLTTTGEGVLAIAGTGSYTGATIINDGELRIRGSNNRLPITTAVTVNDPGILNLNGLSQQIGSLSGNGDVGTGAGTLTVNGAADTLFTGALKNIANAGAAGVTSGNGRLIKSGTGILTFGGLNDISGSVTLNAGGIVVNPGASLAGPLADIVVNGGALTLNNAAQPIRNLNGTGGSIVLGAGHTLTVSPGAASTYAGTISGSGGLTKAGTFTETLSGDSTYTGATNINAGTLLISGSLSADSAVTVGDGANLGTTALLAGSGTVGDVAAVGSGDPAASGASIDPGNSTDVAGILNTRALSITNGAHLSMQIGGTFAGGETATGHDQIVAAGAVTLTGGDLKLTLQGDPSFAVGDTLFLVVNNSGAAVTGAFSTLNGSAFDPSNIVLNGQQFELTYTANFAGAGSDATANDVAITAVPEPGTAVLVGFAALGLGLRRRRAS